MLSLRLKTTMHRNKILFNVVLILLGQHCTGKNLVQCCPRSFRQHCTGKILFNVVLILLGQHCTDKYLMWCCPWGSRQHKVSTRKTKIMVSRVDLQRLKDSGNYSCSVFRKCTGSDSIYCFGWLHWVHKKWSGSISWLNPNPDYCCSRCKGAACTIDGRPYNEWLFVQDKKLDVVDSLRSVPEVMILGLSWEFSLRGASFRNSCQY